MKELKDYGLLTLGSYLKKISDQLFREIDEVYAELGISLSSRFVSCLLLIKDNGEISVTQLAEKLGQTHSAISQMSKKLKEHDLVFDVQDPLDERRRLLSLTPNGYNFLDKLRRCFAEIRRQLAEDMTDGGNVLLKQLELLDESIERRPLGNRILEKIGRGPMNDVVIVDFQPEYRDAFKALNVEWLEKYFYVEAIDNQVLSFPEKYILEPGGHIFIALVDGKAVGTAALLKADDESYELTKMSVTDGMQGLGIGRQLAVHAIDWFKQSGKPKLFLESNSKLKPALALYESLGFVHRPKPEGESHYQRADVYMEYLSN